jgi:hypothetical protein
VPDQNLKLERSNPVPQELVNEDSHIGALIETARTVASSKSMAARVLAERAQVLIKNACPSYQPNEASKASLMCASGRDNGVPFRGEECCNSGCLVSQIFQEDGKFFFMGKRPVEDALVVAIFREVPTDEDDNRKRPEAQEAD